MRNCWPLVLIASIAALGCAYAQTPATPTPALRPFRVASDYPSIQAAVDSLPPTGGTVYLPEGRWVLDKALDLTCRTYYDLPPQEREKRGLPVRIGSYIHLTGAGNGTILEGRMKDGPVIDMTDSSYCTLSNFQIWSNTAQCGILLARPDPKNRAGVLRSAGWDNFYNLWINGSYSVANVYSLTSEVDKWWGCWFTNGAPDSYCFVFTHRNFAQITSPFVGELAENVSCADQRLFGCFFMHYCTPRDKANPGGATIYLRGYCEDITVTDCDFGSAGVKATLWLDCSQGPVKQLHVTNNRFENSDTDLVFANGTEDMASWQVTFRDNNCYGTQRRFLESPGAANYWQVAGNLFYGATTPGLAPLHFGALNNSVVERNWFLNEPEANQGKVPQVVVDGACADSEVQVPRSEDFQGKLVRSRLTALNDNGTRREYLGDPSAPVVLNLPLVDTAKLPNPKRGDLALDSGANTKSGKPGLAVYDGEKWQYTN